MAFPACAGMNRESLSRLGGIDRVARMRGDEPIAKSCYTAGPDVFPAREETDLHVVRGADGEDRPDIRSIRYYDTWLSVAGGPGAIYLTVCGQRGGRP